MWWNRVSLLFFFSSRRRHTRFDCDWSSDVCFPISLVDAEDRISHRVLGRNLRFRFRGCRCSELGNRSHAHYPPHFRRRSVPGGYLPPFVPRFLSVKIMITRRELLASSLLLPLLNETKGSYSLGHATITWGPRLEQAFDDISAAGFTGIQFRSPEFDAYRDRAVDFQSLLAARKLVCVAMSGGTVNLDAAKRQEYIDRSVEQAKWLKTVGA